MAFPIQQLLSQKQKPIIVSQVELADVACRTMREHGFSQLPVVSDKGIALGLVSHESILRALGHFRVALDKLRVSAALIRPRMFFPDDDLLDLLDPLSEDYAALIVDKENRLLGILTQDDLLVYFRRRAEDMILVRGN
jgi:cystathionine beta-synthase